jgi:hypothetical protein
MEMPEVYRQLSADETEYDGGFNLGNAIGGIVGGIPGFIVGGILGDLLAKDKNNGVSVPTPEAPVRRTNLCNGLGQLRMGVSYNDLSMRVR